MKYLCPTFVSDGGEKVEALTVDIHLKDITISVTSAYGPQESDSIENKNAFWTYTSDDSCRA